MSGAETKGSEKPKDEIARARTIGCIACGLIGVVVDLAAVLILLFVIRWVVGIVQAML